MEHVLHEEHNQQLVEYLSFLRRKRDNTISEVAAEFNEIKETRLFDDSYHVDDVVGMLDGLLNIVRSNMKRDIQASMFSSVLLLKQVLEQAEKSGLSLSTDMRHLEDMALLRAVEDWDTTVHGHSGSAPPPLRARAALEARRAPTALPVIGSAQDPKLLSELQNSREDNATLQERFSRLQVECTAALREKSTLQAQLDASRGGGSAADAEVEGLRQQVADLQADLNAAYDQQHASAQQGGGASEQLMRELHAAQDHNAQLAAELDAARAEMEGRVERSQQFMNLRQMLNKKNSVVRHLRETMQAHGIHVDDVDATDD